MISIVYLLTSKWHDVDEITLFVLAMIDLLTIAIIVALRPPEVFG